VTLRQANVFVAALDARRDLVPPPPAVRRPLQLELRGSAPGRAAPHGTRPPPSCEPG